MFAAPGLPNCDKTGGSGGGAAGGGADLPLAPLKALSKPLSNEPLECVRE